MVPARSAWRCSTDRVAEAVNKPLVVTAGDPLGIGPEVAVRGLVSTRASAVLVGRTDVLFAEATRWGLKVRPFDGFPGAPGVAIYDPGAAAEPVEVASIRWGVAAVRAGQGRALVTGPIHKARLAARGFSHAGHTEFLGELCGVAHPVMAFVGAKVGVVLATVHVPLRAVAQALSVEKLVHVIRTTDAAWRRHVGTPRVVVCGLNPHAGDGGVLGREEIDVIGPAVVVTRAEGIDVVGPVSAEAAWNQPRANDVIVAMYHDQGLVPLKALAFGRCVNWTLGLPIVRTSVDHGTGDDLVGTDLADPGSMVAALRWARRLTASGELGAG